MMNNLNYQEVSSILAGLRILQDHIETGTLKDYRKLPHFEDIQPLSSNQIDTLCENINLNTLAIHTP